MSRRVSIMPPKRRSIIEMQDDVVEELKAEVNRLDLETIAVLREIDRKLVIAIDNVNDKLIPAIERYGAECEEINKFGEMWKLFFARAAGVQLQAYEEPVPSGSEGMMFDDVEGQEEESTEYVQDPQAEQQHAGQQHADSENKAFRKPLRKGVLLQEDEDTPSWSIEQASSRPYVPPTSASKQMGISGKPQSLGTAKVDLPPPNVPEDIEITKTYRRSLDMYHRISVSPEKVKEGQDPGTPRRRTIIDDILASSPPFPPPPVLLSDKFDPNTPGQEQLSSIQKNQHLSSITRLSQLLDVRTEDQSDHIATPLANRSRILDDELKELLGRQSNEPRSQVGEEEHDLVESTSADRDLNKRRKIDTDDQSTHENVFLDNNANTSTLFFSPGNKEISGSRDNTVRSLKQQFDEDLARASRNEGNTVGASGIPPNTGDLENTAYIQQVRNQFGDLAEKYLELKRSSKK